MQLLHYNYSIEQLGKRYTLMRLLGSGGTADVYLAWDEHDSQEVAVKVIRPNVLDPRMLERFLREGKVVASLRHPHIIHIDSDGVQEETFTSSDTTSVNECKVPYIVMEYAKGGDLRERLKPGQALPLAEIMPIFGQLCAAVQYVHDRGMIHRDIKPANVLFREPPQEGGEVEVVLSDFDLQDTSLIQGVSGTANPDNRQVTVRPLNSTKTATKQVAATGSFHQDAQSASGNIIFFNRSLTAFDVPAGTTFQVGSVQIVTGEKAVVPAATVVTPLQPGQITVSAHAVQGGVAGNIAASAINQSCCGSTNITAQNQNALTGGKDAIDYRFLQQSDVDGFFNADEKMLTQDTYNNIKVLMKFGEQLLGEIQCDDANVTEDVPPGDQGPAKAVTTAHVTMSVTCSAEVFDASAVQRIAQNELKQKAVTDLGEGYVLANKIVTQVRPQTQQDKVSFWVTAQGIWYYRWTDTLKRALLNAIKGKSITQAQDIVNSYPGVSNAKIAISNGKSTLPSDVNQMTVGVKVP